MKVLTKSKQVPSLEEEMALLSQGYSFIAGVDEAGRGSLAGPVVAAAVILPLGDRSPSQFDPDECLERFAGVRDSKQLTAKNGNGFSRSLCSMRWRSVLVLALSK